MAGVTRRRFLATAAALAFGMATAGAARGGARATPPITVYKSPT